MANSLRAEIKIPNGHNEASSVRVLWLNAFVTQLIDFNTANNSLFVLYKFLLQMQRN